MTDLETMKAMLNRAGVEYEESPAHWRTGITWDENNPSDYEFQYKPAGSFLYLEDPDYLYIYFDLDGNLVHFDVEE